MQLLHVTAFWLRLARNILLDLFLYVHRFCPPSLLHRRARESIRHLILLNPSHSLSHRILDVLGQSTARPPRKLLRGCRGPHPLICKGAVVALNAALQFAIPNERPSRKAPCKRQTPQPVPLPRPHGPTKRRHSRFPGVAAQRKLAATLAPPHEPPAAAIRQA